VPCATGVGRAEARGHGGALPCVAFYKRETDPGSFSDWRRAPDGLWRCVGKPGEACLFSVGCSIRSQPGGEPMEGRSDERVPSNGELKMGLANISTRVGDNGWTTNQGG